MYNQLMGGHKVLMHRLFTKTDTDRVDDLGFLDVNRTPLLRFDAILAEPLAWVLGPPWLGKSTVANAVEDWLRTTPDALGGVGRRYCVTRLGTPNASYDIPPPWWAEWCRENQPQPAVWLIDGVDEVCGQNEHLFKQILREIDETTPDHLRQLRLILFSRPHAELSRFRKELQQPYSGINQRLESPRFRLTRLDRTAAEQLVGLDRFPHVLDVIRRNALQPVAGYPIVLHHLARYSETARLTVSEVWKSILIALLGERQTNRRATFATEPLERFEAARRIAAALTLAHRDTIQEYSPDREVPTLHNLFQQTDSRLHAAARDACQTAGFVALPEQGAFRFTQRNVQDWFTAFALEPLPVPTLRSALVGPDGALAGRLREPARLIRTITERADVRTEIDRLAGGILLPSDAAEPTLAEAVRCLNQLEELTQTAPWGMRLGYQQHEELARLRVDGIGAVLVERLRDPARSHHVKSMLIDVAEATQALEVADAAMELVLDPTQDDEVRYEALWFVCRYGGDAHLRQLEMPIGEGDDDSEIAARLRGVLLAELLKRRFWPVWRVTLCLPRVNPDLLDQRVVLLRSIPDQLTVEGARQLLPHLQTLYERHADQDYADRLPDLLDRIVELVTQQVPPDSQDIDQLVRFALELANASFTWSVARAVAFLLRPFASARRCFYENYVEAMRNNQGERLFVAGQLLIPQDWRWLRDQALGPWIGLSYVWRDAYWMARTVHDEGQLAETEWQEFVTLVEQHAPGLPAQVEEGVRQQELERQQRETKQRERQERDPSRRPLVERVTRLLEHAGRGEHDRMWRLGFLCFPRVVGLDAQADGDWEGLPADLRRRALDACRRGLEVGQPTPIPSENSFPGSILGEGAAFYRVVFSQDHAGWLTEPMVRRWLPTALFARTSGDWAELIRVCWAVSPAATESVLVETIANQAQWREGAYCLREIPSECWTDAMTDQVGRLLRDDTIRPRFRRGLLEESVSRCPELADPIAADWANRPVAAEDETDLLRQGGRNVLLVRCPTRAFDLIEPDFAARGAPALEELSVLWGWHDEFHIRWGQWPLDLLERLGRMLLRGYPPANDPEFEGGWVGVAPDHELRQIRGRLIDLLLQRPEPDAQAVVDRLAELDPKVRAWVETCRASDKAGRLIPKFDPMASRDPAALSVSEAVRVLERTGYRLIRSADDLLDALMEALRHINKDIGHDLPMLYSAPEQTTKGKQPKTNTEKPREHLHEDALQAYLRRRLLEQLPLIVDRVNVQIDREPQVARRQRFDLKVTAPCHGTRNQATVVIEVKWSMNPEARNALIDQLGERYLRDEGLTHGVFLVGWSGKWRRGDRSRANTNRHQLERHLTSQRDDYCREGQPGSSLRIEPFVLDVQWHRPNETQIISATST